MKIEGKVPSNIRLLTFVLVVMLCVSSYSQDKQAGEPDRPSSCEHVTIVLDDSMQRVQKLGEHSTLIVIFRLGMKEKNNALNSRRMKLVEYSVERRRARLRLVLAASPEPSDGLGRADIYVGGQLVYALFFAHNSKQCKAHKW